MRPRASLTSPDVTSPCASKAARLSSRRPIMTTRWPAAANTWAIPWPTTATVSSVAGTVIDLSFACGYRRFELEPTR